MIKNMLISWISIFIGYFIATALGFKFPKVDFTDLSYWGFLAVTVSNFVAGAIFERLENKRSLKH